MMQEFEKRAHKTEAFLREYGTMRKTVEAYLRGGIKNEGTIYEQFENFVQRVGLRKGLLPSYFRETIVEQGGFEKPAHIVVTTTWYVHNSNKIDNAYISISITDGTGGIVGPLYLPPVIKFTRGEERAEDFDYVFYKMADVLPILQQELKS